ncbi:Uncharacterised protein [Burkholderia pseudomallei]|nr:Uncharacterised protein [Burkholderia pseudomallei]CAJ6702470.1 Uncharacterised protein [Burkholderia pseudomallei]
MSKDVSWQEPLDEARLNPQWLSRSDAMSVAYAIAMSESGPRRWLVSIAAVLCRVSRAADRMFCSIEDDRDKLGVSPTALAYLTSRVSADLMERIQLHHRMNLERIERKGRGHVSAYASTLTVEPLITVLGAGYIAERRARRLGLGRHEGRLIHGCGTERG